jgi:hypothetical protein
MATPTQTETAPELTAEQKAEIFNNLPKEFQDALRDLNASIDGHNSKVDSIKAAESKDPKLIKAEIFEQSDNKGIVRLRTEYEKLTEAAEKLRMQAYEAIEKNGLMPKDLSEEEVTKLKGEVTESTKELRDQSNALEKMEAMMPMFKGKLVPLIGEIKTRRGTAKTGGTTAKGDGPKRPRFKKIEVNGVTQDDNGNTVWREVNGEQKYTFTLASQYLSKQHKGINWTSADLTAAWAKDIDIDNPPEQHTFVMPYTFKDNNGNEQTVNYEIKTYR